MANGTRTKYLNACALRYMAWRDEGNAPKTRTAAMAIIGTELIAAGHQVSLKEIKSQVARSIMNGDDLETIDDNLGYMVWDLTVNSGLAFDYSVNRNYFAGLLLQVRNALLTATRMTVATQIAARAGETAGRIEHINIPTIVTSKTTGAVRLVDLNPERLEGFAHEFIEGAKNTIKRWKFLGADRKFVIKVLKKLAVEVLRDVLPPVARTGKLRVMPKPVTKRAA
jgi:hypothetical protein